MFSHDQIVALIATTSFAAGLNVYATVATLGLLARADVLALPQSLHLVQSWPVIIICGVMFVIEFFADKIPAFDLIWNALHTFVRIPVAGWIAYAAAANLPPGLQIMSAAAGGTIALAAHGGKMAARAAVTPSPEPFSNAALSVGEDVIAVGLTWFASTHPILAGLLVLVFLIGIIYMIRFIIRAMRRLFQGAERVLTRSDQASPQLQDSSPKA